MIDGRNFFDQSIKNGLKTYDNIRKIETGQGNVERFFRTLKNKIYKQMTSISKDKFDKLDIIVNKYTSQHN